MKTEFGAKRA